MYFGEPNAACRTLTAVLQDRLAEQIYNHYFHPTSVRALPVWLNLGSHLTGMAHFPHEDKKFHIL